MITDPRAATEDIDMAGHPQQQQSEEGSWNVQASSGALNTSNPIREIIETMNLAENPQKKVIPLSIGDPTIFGNLKPCNEILEALDKANSSCKHFGYQIAAGMEGAREAVADYYNKATGCRIKRQDVILASGCSHALDLCICVLARPGQNILIPRPGFPLYKTLTSVYGVKYKQYNLIPEKNWSIDLEHLESLIDDQTAAILINNPSNPCGSVFSRKHLLEILELANRYKKPIIADEIYDKLIFNSRNNCNVCYQTENRTIHHNNNNNNIIINNKQITITKKTTTANIINNNNLIVDDVLKYNNVTTGLLHLDEDDQGFGDGRFIAMASLSKTVPILTCGGISKTCLIPGLRLGWIIINDRQNIFDKSVRMGLMKLTQRLMGPNSLVQGALHDILTKVPESFYIHTMSFIYENACLCYERIRCIEGLVPYMPQGSMYLMVRFEPKAFPNIKGDLDFTSKLMNEESVLVLPGSCFDFPNYFRICLTVPKSVMQEALDRMAEFCQRYYSGLESAAFSSQLVAGKGNSPTTKPTASRLINHPLMNGNTTNKCRV